MLELTQENIDKIISLGKLAYDANKSANVLQLTGKERDKFLQQFADHKSEIQKYYQIGIDLGDFEIDKKIYELAKTGDVNAIKLYTKNKQDKQELSRIYNRS